MVTRLYFRQDGLGLHKSLINLAALGWVASDYYNSLLYCQRLGTSKTTTAYPITAFLNAAAGTNPRDIAWEAYLSDPLQAQTLSGTFQAQARAAEGSTSYELAAQMKAYVVNSSGAVVHTLYGGYTGAIASEFVTSFTNRTFPVGAGSGVALSSYSCAAGDRILVIIGARSYNTVAVTLALSLSTVGSDLPIDQTTTTGDAWVQFSADILFNSSVEPLVPGGEPGYIAPPVNRIQDPRAMYGEQDSEEAVVEVPLTLQQWPRGNFGW